MVAGSEDPLKSKIETVRAVERKNDSFQALGTEQFGGPLTAAVDKYLYLKCLLVGSSTNGHADVPIVIVDGVVDFLGLGKVGSGVVEVNAGS